MRTNPCPPRLPGTTLPEICTIRDYADADESAVVAIIRELQIHERQYDDRLKPPESIGPWYIQDLMASIIKHNGRLLVAEAGDAIAGYAGLLVEVTSQDERDEMLYSYSYVADLEVLKSHRGRGIGQALLSECERLTRAAGLKWLRLGVLADNRDARHFYARFGFAEKLLTLEKSLT